MTLSDFSRDVGAIVDAEGFGVMLDAPGQRAQLVTRYRAGVLGHLFPLDRLPAVLNPSIGALRIITPLSSHDEASHPIVDRLLKFGIDCLVVMPLPGGLGVFWTGKREPSPFTDQQVAALENLVVRVAAAIREPESRDARVARLVRVDAVEQVLPVISDALDVREVFHRLSDVARTVIAHDAATIQLLSEDHTQLRLHALDGIPRESVPDTFSTQYAPVFSEYIQFAIHDDLLATPAERDRPTAKAGLRSALRLPLRIDGRMGGTLEFCSTSVGAYTEADVSVGRRIADYVALAMAHQRMADDARRAEALRERSDNLLMLDDLLATLAGVLDVRQVFDRVSVIAQKALPHDAMTVTQVLDSQDRIRLLAISGFSHIPDFPDSFESVLPEPSLLTDPWDYRLIDDFGSDPRYADSPTVKAGMQSVLGLPVRLEGRLKQSDILIARRIADRFALCLSRERSAAASKRADEASARASRLESRVNALTEELDARTGYRRVVGASAQWRQVLTQATQVASTDTTVLLLGESGTGKEVIARFLHRASARNEGPFIALNCAALPEHLLEAELFGYERGAFTGATQSKPGQLEQAAGGTLFLDEVGDMSPPAQAKFLRVLQEREFQRLGGSRVLRTDVRIVAATNRDLQRAMKQGTFREDLFYRLNVFAIHLPPLRHRPDDVLPMSEAFLAEYGRGLGRPPAGISRDARQLLMNYHWPGNVRELRNILERAAIICDGGLITAEHLAVKIAAPRPRVAEPPDPPAFDAVDVRVAPPSSAGDLQSIERTMIEQALQNARFNKSKAAQELGLTRAQLYVRMKRYGLE
jgi:transcriptional regulator with GAF, ATPase, and Fis domain